MSKHKSEDYKITAVKYYLENNTNYTKTCKTMWNRDVNSATNIYRIAKNSILQKPRPKYLCRDKKEDNNESNKKIKSTKEKVNKSTKSQLG